MRHYPPEDEFARAANLLCGTLNAVADMFADLSERLAGVLVYGNTGLFLSDTMEWLQFWEHNASQDAALDGQLDAQQNWNFPQP